MVVDEDCWGSVDWTGFEDSTANVIRSELCLEFSGLKIWKFEILLKRHRMMSKESLLPRLLGGNNVKLQFVQSMSELWDGIVDTQEGSILY